MYVNVKRWVVWSIIIVCFLVFSVHSYRLRTNFNAEKQEKQVKKCEHQIEVLTHALSLVPKSIKNEVYFNSIKEKFPGIEKDEQVLNLIDITFFDKYGDKEEKEKDKEKLTANVVVDKVIQFGNEN